MRIGKLPVRTHGIEQLDCAVIKDKDGKLLCIAACPVPAGAVMLVLTLNSDDELTPEYQAFDLEGRYMSILKQEFPDLDWIK